MLPCYVGEAQPVSQNERQASQLIIATLIGVVVIAAIVGYFTGDYGTPIGVAITIIWIPACLVVGAIAEKMKLISFE